MLKELNFKYTIADDSVTITKYTGSASIITIPYGVTSIGEDAFSWCNSLTSVTIPNGVTSIGDGAFRNCYSLTSVTIPKSVTSIGYGPFTECYKLTEIRVSAGNTHFKSIDGILFTADGKTLIQVPRGKGLTEYTIPDGVTSIGDDAFSHTSLTSVTNPNSVTSIGDDTFSWCESLTSVTIPDSVTSIGDVAFEYCDSLTSVTIPNSVTSIGDDTCSWCESLTSVTIPDSVTSIGNKAFKYCDRLTIYGTEGSAAQTYAKSDKIPFSTGPLPYCDAAGVYYSHDGKTLLGAPRSLSGEYTIPDSVTSIGNRAFYKCTSLTLVTIPDSVTSIGNYAFYECSSLTSVTIPNSVTSIGDRAFYSCESLTSVTIPNSVTSIGNYAFSCCRRLTIYGTEGSASQTYAKSNEIPFSTGPLPYCDATGVYYSHDGKTLLGAPRSLSGEYTIPDSVTSIGNEAFWCCTNLTSVTIPDSVTSIGN